MAKASFCWQNANPAQHPALGVPIVYCGFRRRRWASQYPRKSLRTITSGNSAYIRHPSSKIHKPSGSTWPDTTCNSAIIVGHVRRYAISSRQSSSTWLGMWEYCMICSSLQWARVNFHLRQDGCNVQSTAMSISLLSTTYTAAEIKQHLAGLPVCRKPLVALNQLYTLPEFTAIDTRIGIIPDERMNPFIPLLPSFLSFLLPSFLPSFLPLPFVHHSQFGNDRVQAIVVRLEPAEKIITRVSWYGRWAGHRSVTSVLLIQMTVLKLRYSLVRVVRLALWCRNRQGNGREYCLHPSRVSAITMVTAAICG